MVELPIKRFDRKRLHENDATQRLAQKIISKNQNKTKENRSKKNLPIRY